MMRRIKVLLIGAVFTMSASLPFVMPQKTSAMADATAGLNLTLFGTNSRYGVKACKRHKDSIYGPLWEVTVVVGRKTPRVLASRAFVIRPANNFVVETPFQHAWYGNVQAYTVLASQLYNDRLRVDVWEKLGQPGYEYDYTDDWYIPVMSLSTC